MKNKHHSSAGHEYNLLSIIIVDINARNINIFTIRLISTLYTRYSSSKQNVAQFLFFSHPFEVLSQHGTTRRLELDMHSIRNRVAFVVFLIFATFLNGNFSS